MKHISSVIFSLSIFGLVLLTACSKPLKLEREQHPLPKDAMIVDCEPGQYGGIFTLAASQEPKTFNYLAATGIYSVGAIKPIFQALVDYDWFDEEYTPGLAKSWDVSSDKLSYTFYLREDVKWSDGEPFTADDVIFTFDLIFDERYSSRYVQQYTIFGEPILYEKIDDYTVRFSTKEPYAPFIYTMLLANILPKHKLEQYADDGTFMQQWSLQTAKDEPREIVGTGPFRLQSFRTGERMVYEPNPHYYKVDQKGQRLPYLDYMIYKFVSDSNAQIALFATGQTDATEIGAADVSWVEKGKDVYGFTLYEAGLANGIRFIWFNLHPGTSEDGVPFVLPYKLKWFKEKDFRHAIAHALDREGMIQAAYAGLGQPLHSCESPAFKKWHNPNTRRYEYDPNKSREILNRLGFRHNQDELLIDKHGNLVEFDLMVSEGSAALERMVTIFVENLKTVGVKVNLQYMDFGTMIVKTGSSYDYEASAMAFSSGLDPAGAEAIYKSNGRLHVWHPDQKNPETRWEKKIDALFESQLREFDSKDRVAIMHEIQEIMSEELPLIYLINSYTYAGIKNHWKNVRVTPDGNLLHNIEEFWTENPNLGL